MIYEKVKMTVNQYRLIDKSDKVIIGISGGPDSLALLYLLRRLSREMGFALHLAHLDHMLRRDSRKDREFIEDLASKLKIPLTVKTIDVNKLPSKGSLEQTARDARLEFFFDTAKKIKADKIALGHNLDDQAETVLMRLIRGSGLYGLAGIIPKREFKGKYCIIRPLIKIKRRQIERYLKSKKIIPLIDKTDA